MGGGRGASRGRPGALRGRRRSPGRGAPGARVRTGCCTGERVSGVILHGVGTADRFDVAVVGASIAGCTAARLYALRGARVALIERRPDPSAWKVVCTHAIQSSAAPTIERLGLAPLLAQRGAVRIHGEAHSPYGGWIHAPPDAPRGYGVTRRTLDPLLRTLAAQTPGVELMTGRTAVGLPGDGVEVETRDGARSVLRARLVVGADGRSSTV